MRAPSARTGPTVWTRAAGPCASACRASAALSVRSCSASTLWTGTPTCSSPTCRTGHAPTSLCRCAPRGPGRGGDSGAGAPGITQNTQTHRCSGAVSESELFAGIGKPAWLSVRQVGQLLSRTQGRAEVVPQGLDPLSQACQGPRPPPLVSAAAPQLLPPALQMGFTCSQRCPGPVSCLLLSRVSSQNIMSREESRLVPMGWAVALPCRLSKGEGRRAA